MTIHLVLKSKWYDMIASGEKKEEYRAITPYWTKRIWKKAVAIVHIEWEEEAQ